MAKSFFAGLLLLLVVSSVASADLIFSLTDPDQTVLPGSLAIYHGVLTNTGNTPVNIITFSFINPPADFMIPFFPITEPAIPFTLQAGGQFAGIVADISVPANAFLKMHNFSVAAFSDQHNMNGDSIGSNFVAGSLTVAPEPANAMLVCAALLAMICLYQTRRSASRR